MTRQDGHSFAERLRQVQHDRRLTNDALAFRSGVSLRLLQKYRAGIVEPRNSFGEPSENARKLANALGVPVDALIPEAAADAPTAA